jgi:hypothetical protein
MEIAEEVVETNGHPTDEERPFVDDPAPDNSLLSRLRAQRQALTEKRTLDLPIPGYSLTARYKAIDYQIVDKITERARKAEKQIGSRASLNAAADILAQACLGIYERRDDDSLVPLNELLPAWGDEPIVYDKRLAEAVGVEIEGNRAREVVFGVFAVDVPDTGNDMALMGHQTEILQWLRQTQDDADADF